MSEKKTPDLYQELIHISPRISRSERILGRRKSYCRDYSLEKLEKVKQSQSIYFFYILILIISVGSIKYYSYKNNFLQQDKQQQKKIWISSSERIILTLVSEKNRHGISLLFRNKKQTAWIIDNITIKDRATGSVFLNNLQISIPSHSFNSSFIMLPKEFNSIKNISVSVNKRKE